MKFLYWFTNFLLTIQASINVVGSHVEDRGINDEKLAYFKMLCKDVSLLPVRMQNGKLTSVLADWEILIEIEECRHLIRTNFKTIMGEEEEFIELLKHGEPVWESFVDLKISKMVYIKFEEIIRRILKLRLEPDDILIRFMIYFLKYSYDSFLPETLYKIDRDRAQMYLNGIANQFHQSEFTKTAIFAVHVAFFQKCACIGLIPENKFIVLIRSIISEIYHSPILKFNYLVSRLFLYDILRVNKDIYDEFHDLKIIGGLDGRENFIFISIERKKLKLNSKIEPIYLEIIKPDIIIDYNFAKKATTLAMDGTLGTDDFKYLLLSISKTFVDLVLEGQIIEANSFVDSLREYSDDDRVFLLQEYLRSFLPSRFSIEELEEFDRQKYLCEFETLLGFEGNKNQIARWSRKHDMSKRLKVWFALKEYHPFLLDFGNLLVNNMQSFVNLISMGEETWKYMREFNMAPSLKYQISKLIKSLKREKLQKTIHNNVTFGNVLSFFVYFLDTYPYALLKSLKYVDPQQRLDFLKVMARNMHKGEFTSSASFSGNLYFFAAAFLYGFISLESYAKLLENVLSALQSGLSITKSYIIEVIGLDFNENYANGSLCRKQNRKKYLNQDLKLLAREPEQFRFYFSSIEGTENEDRLDIDLELPIIMSDKKFAMYLLPFALGGDQFKDLSFIESSLTFVAIQIIVESFLIMAAREAHECKSCLQALYYLESSLSVLDDTELANRIYKVLWSVVPFDLRP